MQPVSIRLIWFLSWGYFLLWESFISQRDKDEKQFYILNEHVLALVLYLIYLIPEWIFFFFFNTALLFTAKLFLAISFKLAYFYYPLISVIFCIWRTFLKFIIVQNCLNLLWTQLCLPLLEDIFLHLNSRFKISIKIVKVKRQTLIYFTSVILWARLELFFYV